MKYIGLVIMLFVLFSCETKEKELTTQEIVDKAIQKAGGDRYKNAEIKFEFRDRIYKSTRSENEFVLERTRIDSTGKIYDILTNSGLERLQNDSLIQVADSLVMPISNSVNSVHYFVHLPYGLNDTAANKKLLGKDSISGKEYYEIKVDFSEKGGGTDHEDEYLYWIHTKNFTVDYLAYSFEVNKGGIRFRKAFNPRRVEGIRFVDYENYKYEQLSTPLKDLDSLYEEGKLELLSKIITEKVEVRFNSTE